MSFYKWQQNNTGGIFVTNDKLCHQIIIEADTEEESEQKAFDMGVYYDGVESGDDCDCCGDRWYSPDKYEFPFTYSIGIVFDNVEDYAQYLADNFGWTIPDIRIFYKNGEVREVFSKNE